MDGNLSMNSQFENMSEKDSNEMADHYIIAEGNNLIAEFMPDMKRMVPENTSYPAYWRWVNPKGYGLKDYVCGTTTSSQEERNVSLNYHSDWNRLKPVVDRIFTFSLAHPDQTQRLRDTRIVVDILPCWQICVDFIKWYNTQNPQQ